MTVHPLVGLSASSMLNRDWFVRTRNYDEKNECHSRVCTLARSVGDVPRHIIFRINRSEDLVIRVNPSGGISTDLELESVGL